MSSRVLVRCSLMLIFFGSVSADRCFQLDSDGNGTLLIPECTGGSEILVVEQKELLVEFTDNGLNQSTAQNLTFNFGDGISRQLPLNILVQYNKTIVFKKSEEDINIFCQSEFQKIGEPTTYMIRVTYRADKPKYVKGLSALYRATIDAPEAPGNSLWKSVGIAGGVFLIAIVIFGAVLVFDAKCLFEDH
ncbi:hypothetical protein M3Y96_00973300 [Aphelenchoides besseyi]|nr:hypothetical protein M3Y96_00973300 [Aphelenchoides besseyi]